MQDAIGQNQVLVPPMEMALVAEAIANQGVILQPHVVDCVLDPNDKVVSRVGVQQYKRAIDPATAGDDDHVHAGGRRTIRAAPAPPRRSPT